MILYRSVGLQELELIYDSGMKAFPARLAQQPIFYPVLQLEYARQIASDWNAKSGQSAGYVTQFRVEDQYISSFEKQTVGDTQHQEFWIPAEEVEEFNRHIIGHIKVVEAYFGDGFQGFVPENFGLQGKNAVEQFTLLTNSFIYKRMDFHLEIRRNHKAVCLNYPFWQKYEFKNPGLTKKVLQAIKDAWFASFPKIPLPLLLPIDEDIPPVQQTGAHSLVNDVPEDTTLEKQADSHSFVNLEDEDVTPAKQTDSHLLATPVHEDTPLVKPAASHFSQGLELGLSGKYHEAIDELSKAVGENPDDVVAYTSLGIAFHRLGDDDRALSYYEAALRIDPTYAEAHYFRANILYSHGNAREAIAGYTNAVGLSPELIEAHKEPALQDRLTDYTGSPAEMYWIAKPAHRILELNKLLETNPGQAYLFKERASEYYRLRNYAQAIADYDAYLAIQPDDASVLHLRGVAYEQIGQLERAQEDYQQALAMDPQLSNLYINRGVTFAQMGRFRQSIASLTQAIRLAPKNPDGYFNRGTIYLQQGDFESAIDDFSNVIRLAPGDEEAYYWRGISNEQAGRQHDATADYRQFLALSPDAHAREEIEQKLIQWNTRSPGAVPDDRQKTNQDRDLYGLILALGERALNSTWYASGVDCNGEKADELNAFANHNRAIDGRDLLEIASGIRQTIEGDFQAFDPAATSHWILIRAWEGSGFYIESDDPTVKQQLQTHFQAVEDVEGAYPPYEGLFIRI